MSRAVTSADVKYAIERGFFRSVSNPYAPAYFGDLAGALPAVAPGTRRSIQRSTVRVAVSTDATRQSGYPSRPGSETYNFRPSGVSATEFGQLRNGCLTWGQ